MADEKYSPEIEQLRQHFNNSVADLNKQGRFDANNRATALLGNAVQTVTNGGKMGCADQTEYLLQHPAKDWNFSGEYKSGTDSPILLPHQWVTATHAKTGAKVTLDPWQNKFEVVDPGKAMAEKKPDLSGGILMHPQHKQKFQAEIRADMADHKPTPAPAPKEDPVDRVARSYVEGNGVPASKEAMGELISRDGKSPWDNGGVTIPGTTFNPGTAAINAVENAGEGIANAAQRGAKSLVQNTGEAIQNIKAGQPVLSNAAKALSGYTDVLANVNPVVANGAKAGEQIRNGDYLGAVGTLLAGLTQGVGMGKPLTEAGAPAAVPKTEAVAPKTTPTQAPIPVSEAERALAEHGEIDTRRVDPNAQPAIPGVKPGDRGANAGKFPYEEWRQGEIETAQKTGKPVPTEEQLKAKYQTVPDRLPLPDETNYWDSEGSRTVSKALGATHPNDIGEPAPPRTKGRPGAARDGSSEFDETVDPSNPKLSGQELLRGQKHSYILFNDKPQGIVPKGRMFKGDFSLERPEDIEAQSILRRVEKMEQPNLTKVVRDVFRSKNGAALDWTLIQKKLLDNRDVLIDHMGEGLYQQVFDLSKTAMAKDYHVSGKGLTLHPPPIGGSTITEPSFGDSISPKNDSYIYGSARGKVVDALSQTNKSYRKTPLGVDVLPPNEDGVLSVQRQEHPKLTSEQTKTVIKNIDETNKKTDAVSDMDDRRRAVKTMHDYEDKINEMDLSEDQKHEAITRMREKVKKNYKTAVTKPFAQKTVTAEPTHAEVKDALSGMDTKDVTQVEPKELRWQTADAKEMTTAEQQKLLDEAERDTVHRDQRRKLKQVAKAILEGGGDASSKQKTIKRIAKDSGAYSKRPLLPQDKPAAIPVIEHNIADVEQTVPTKAEVDEAMKGLDTKGVTEVGTVDQYREVKANVAELRKKKLIEQLGIKKANARLQAEVDAEVTKAIDPNNTDTVLEHKGDSGNKPGWQKADKETQAKIDALKTRRPVRFGARQQLARGLKSHAAQADMEKNAGLHTTAAESRVAQQNSAEQARMLQEYLKHPTPSPKTGKTAPTANGNIAPGAANIDDPNFSKPGKDWVVQKGGMADIDKDAANAMIEAAAGGHGFWAEAPKPELGVVKKTAKSALGGDKLPTIRKPERPPVWEGDGKSYSPNVKYREGELETLKKDTTTPAESMKRLQVLNDILWRIPEPPSDLPNYHKALTDQMHTIYKEMDREFSKLEKAGHKRPTLPTPDSK